MKYNRFKIWNSWFEPVKEDPVPTMCMYVFGTTVDQMKNVNEEEVIAVVEQAALDDAVKTLNAILCYDHTDSVVKELIEDCLERVEEEGL